MDSWRAVIAAQPHLAKWFVGPDGRPDDEYKARVKKRFVQWVLDACFRPHDQAWLDYQQEIGMRHTPAKKNQTDHAQTPSVVPLRYLIAFGFLVSGLALITLTQINLMIDFETAVLWRIFQAVGLAFLFVPINTAAYAFLPREKNNAASGCPDAAAS